jgi:hypothetical protein
MEKTDDEFWNEDQCLAHIMRVTGKTRRQAKAALLEKLRDGSIPARGENIDTGRIEIIPKDYWPAVN